MKVSRRDALTRLAAGGVGAVLAPAIIRGQAAPIIVAGRPVEILVRPLGEFTVRISLRPIVGGRPQPVINRGALAEPVGGNESRVETGDMVVSVVEGATTTITVRRRGRIVQTLSLSRDESTIAFAIGNGPISGLGEGGPQFDRRGTQYPSRNGQGGYQLRTHGGRVPIQWLVSTDGWGMYIHQPLGSFDLMGSIGRLMPTSETIVGINGSMVNGTPVIRPARGEAPSIPPWDSADFPDRTARISGRTASSNRRPAWPDAGLRPDQASGRTSPRPTARRSHGQLIDVSGSMTSADRLPMLRSALALFVDSLGPEDKVSIVTYAGTSGVALPTTPARHRAVIQRAIAQLESGGSTNGAAGIETAYHMARQAFVRGGVNRVILATDGDFNVGVTGEDELLKLVEREKASGIFLSVLGVGTDNLNDAMMELVADRGNGHYPYLDSMQEARRVLLREASSTLEVVARDVRFQVEFNPAVVAAWKQIG